MSDKSGLEALEEANQLRAQEWAARFRDAQIEGDRLRRDETHWAALAQQREQHFFRVRELNSTVHQVSPVVLVVDAQLRLVGVLTRKECPVGLVVEVCPQVEVVGSRVVPQRLQRMALLGRVRAHIELVDSPEQQIVIVEVSEGWQ